MGGLALTTPAWADLYDAVAAVEKNDLPRAVALYREIAELGHPAAQENLAAMYVNGEGVKRDNVLGYAWAKLALEHGKGEVAQSIVSQLEPRLSDAARATAAALQAQFGRAALANRILPAEAELPPAATSSRCTVKSPANPSFFYPQAAKRNGISGMVVMQVPVKADGSSRTPRAWYSFPAGVFDEAGRAVALASHYQPTIENGVATDCSLIFRVRFSLPEVDYSKPDPKSAKKVADAREMALAGDPMSQLAYGAVLSIWPNYFNTYQERYVSWFLKAAQAGLPDAQYLVGVHVLDGNSFRKDQAKGEFWLEQGAKGGSGAAQAALAAHLLRPGADQASRDQGFEWMRRSAESRHREGKFLFSSLLVSWPDAMRRDPARALALLGEIENSFDYDPASFEIRAMALAEQGDFKAAQREQSQAIRVAKKLKWDTSKQQARLASYEKAQLPEGMLIEF
jgi:TPR repeat protein